MEPTFDDISGTFQEHRPLAFLTLQRAVARQLRYDVGLFSSRLLLIHHDPPVYVWLLSPDNDLTTAAVDPDARCKPTPDIYDIEKLHRKMNSQRRNHHETMNVSAPSTGSDARYRATIHDAGYRDSFAR